MSAFPTSVGRVRAIELAVHFTTAWAMRNGERRRRALLDVAEAFACELRLNSEGPHRRAALLQRIDALLSLRLELED